MICRLKHIILSRPIGEASPKLDNGVLELFGHQDFVWKGREREVKVRRQGGIGEVWWLGHIS